MLFANYSFSQVKEKNDFIDNILNVLIKNKEGKKIEFPNIYDHLTDKILDDNEEKLILFQKLKERGFLPKNFGRGNYPPLGARIINITMIKDNCECEINKIYYFTIDNNLFEMRENIECHKLIK